MITSLSGSLKRSVSMADMDSPAGSLGQETSTCPQTANDTAQPGEQISPSAEEVVPLFDIIETCLEELPALREIMPSRHPRAYLMSDGGLYHYSPSLEWSADFLSELDHLLQSDMAVLIIEDIDAYWFQALATRYPASLDVRFVAQHVLRQGGLSATYDSHEHLREAYQTLVSRVDAGISRRQSDTTAYKDLHCRHINGRISRATTEVGPDHVTCPEMDYRVEMLTQ